MWGFSKHLLLAALGLMLSAVSAYADLGWTPAQSVQAYGKPTAGPDDEGLDETIYQFEAQGYTIYASYLYGRVRKITYHRQAALDESLINFFKTENCPNTQWHVVIEGGSGYWSGQVDGKEAYVAGLSDHHTSSVAACR